MAVTSDTGDNNIFCIRIVAMKQQDKGSRKQKGRQSDRQKDIDYPPRHVKYPYQAKSGDFVFEIPVMSIH